MKAPRPHDWNDVERIAGIKRTVSAAPTQNDIENLTARYGPEWYRRKLRRARRRPN